MSTEADKLRQLYKAIVADLELFWEPSLLATIPDSKIGELKETATRLTNELLAFPDKYLDTGVNGVPDIIGSSDEAFRQLRRLGAEVNAFWATYSNATNKERPGSGSYPHLIPPPETPGFWETLADRLGAGISTVFLLGGLALVVYVWTKK